MAVGLGVLNAPVEAFCNLSNSSCSFGGRRGGAGPVANAVRREVEVKNRRHGRRNLGGKSRDIVLFPDNWYLLEGCEAFRAEWELVVSEICL